MSDKAAGVEVASEIVGPESGSTAVALLDPLLRIESGLNALRAESDAADWDVATAKGEAAAREFRARCVKVRTGAMAAYEQGNGPLLAAQRQARDLVKKINLAVQPIEDFWDKLIKEKEDRKAREKAEREQAERERVAGIRSRIQAIESVPLSCANASSPEIDVKLQQLGAIELTEEHFGEFVAEAHAAQLRANSALKDLLSAAAHREHEAARLKAEREELARQQDEAQRVAAIRERINAIHLMIAQVDDSSGSVAHAIDAVRKLPLTEEEFGELLVEAQLAASVVLGKLTAMLGTRLEREKQERALQEEREAERRRVEANLLEQKRLDDEARVRREAEAAELKRQQDAFEAEKRKALEQIAAERAEQNRIEAERKAEAARIEAAKRAEEERLAQMADDARDSALVSLAADAFEVDDDEAINILASFNAERQRALRKEAA